jgi:two-component system, sensor histidine kinase and response regulator
MVNHNDNNNSQSDEPVDKTAGLTNAGGDEDILQDVIQVFLEEAPKQVMKMKEALKNKNVKDAEREVHTLKGSASNIGADPLMKKALQAEMALKNGKLEEASFLFLKVEVEFEKVRRFLSNTNSQDNQNAG